MRASLLAAACATVLAFIPLQANAKTKCVKKAGEGWGITRGIAEFQSFEIGRAHV